MIGMLLWFIVAAGFVYELTARNIWHDVFSAMVGAGFVVWVFGGAVLLAMRGKLDSQKEKRRAYTPEQQAKLADLAARARATGSGEGK